MIEQPEQPPQHTQRTPYVVGDIHGCLETYLCLEHKIEVHAKKFGFDPLIISVGDLVDRGPRSAEVVERFLRGEKEGTHAAIIGNHEVEFLKNIYSARPELFVEAGTTFPWHIETFEQEFEGDIKEIVTFDEYRIFQRIHWYFQGGIEALKSYHCNPKDPESWAISPEHIRYLASMPLFWENEDIIVTHGFAKDRDYEILKSLQTAISAIKGTSRLPEEPILEREAAHNAIWSRKLPRHPMDPKRLHCSGHTPVPRVRRLTEINAMQIDTGCVYGRRLTAYCPSVDQVVSVKSLET